MTIAAIIEQVLLNIMLVVTMILVGITIGRVIGRIIARIFTEADIQKLHRYKIDLGLLSSKIAEYVVYVITILIVTEHVGITRLTFTIVIGTILIIIFLNVLAVILFSIPNIIKGFTIRKTLSTTVGRPFANGTIKGVIIKQGYTALEIRARNGDVFIVPYKSLQF